MGNDVMDGGFGTDIYDVDSSGDIVIEFSNAPNSGYDIVYAAASFTIGANIERLYLYGNGAIDATGNELSNVIVGNDANNTMDGGDGPDYLNGLGGNDILLGGNSHDNIFGGNGDDILIGGVGINSLTGDAGIDQFKYNSLVGQYDYINDFVVGTDKLVLTGLGLGVENLSFGGRSNSILTIAQAGLTATIDLQGLNLTAAGATINFITNNVIF
jgi:Ca2+-binding RTX toxin-like protein